MRIYDISLKTLVFKGVREDRNTVEQLKKENDYSLSENNQKKISKAIDNIGQSSDERNVKFLLDVAENLKYSTNIDTGAEPNNNWKLKLQTAVTNSIAKSSPVVKEKYEPQIKKLFSTEKPLSPVEQEILQLKGSILKKIDKSQLNGEKNTNITNIEGNLNNLIVSSEIPINQKKYILNRFEYFLSPEYKINPQLSNKKTVVLAEMLNDLVVNSNNSKIPNTKAINQKSHGMCAAISIARKLMSYEFKTDYVDSILSELNDSDSMEVYDLAHLGERKKIPVQKTFVDFEDALNKGYRIVDASTTQWMNIADMFGIDNKSEMVYTAFDPAHFGTFTDSHYKKPLNDDKFDTKQTYYQSLIKAKKSLDIIKINQLEKKDKYFNKTNHLESDLKMINDLNNSLGSKVKKIVPSLSQNEVHTAVNKLLSLENTRSAKIDKIKNGMKKYNFLYNEEDVMKDKKIKSYIADTYKNKADLKFLDENIKDIRDLIEMSNSITNRTNINNPIVAKIRKDRDLFNAAAAYRTSMVMSLYDDDLKTDSMIHYNIDDVESYLSDTLTRYIERVKQGDKVYINHFASNFGVKADKKEIIKLLSDIKEGIDYIINERFDQFYYMLGVGSRKNALLGQVRTIKDTIEKGDKNNLRSMSITMGIKKDKNKIVAKLSEFEEILSGNPTEKQCREIFNKIGNKNQMKEIAEAFETMAEAIKEPNDEFNAMIINRCKQVNGIDINAPVEELQPAMMYFAKEFNEISENIELIRRGLEVYDKDRNLIDCANPTFKILKKMENEGKIIPTKELMPLQKRYDAIDKLRSQDEFSSRQGKILDPSLYKYTNGEKETLKKIKKLTNMMASDVNKEMTGIYREIRKDLEEHTRKIGVNMGMFWAPKEGSSGLYKFQQTKILQQLTDKPYKAVDDLEKAIEIIKNSPHSGISGSSVFHDKIGMHAQYVAEIAEKDGKEILFHDNTWGASEHENTWTDSENQTRTDYSDRRGGELGYITDSKWRNGNYVKNLIEKTGDYKPEYIVSRQIRKLKNEYNERYKFPLITEIILPGVDEQADTIVASIKDNIFLPDSNFISNLDKVASKMSLAQIKSARTRSETAGKLYQKELDEIDKRLEITPFNKSIKSKLDYDALADNDNLKVLFEKAALSMSYKYIPIWKELAKINTVAEVNELKEKQKAVAKENFEYAFAKKPEILYAYALNKNKNNIFEIINNALKNNNINLTDDEKIQIITNTAVYQKDEKNQFDGNLEHTIDFMVNKLLKQFDTIVKNSENAEKAKQEIKENLTKDLQKTLYFTKKDIMKDTVLHEAIKKYIDKKYNPQTDEEFIEIYQKLQNMTTEEFNAETKDVTDEDIAFKNYTGYEMLVKYRASNSVVNDEIRNLVWQKHIVNDIDFSETNPSFQYKKLQKKVRGSVYENGRTYDDLYRTFKYSLSSLNYEKLFNKYKDENFRKYGVMPAYPKVDVFNENLAKEKIKIIDNYVNETIGNIYSKKINLYTYELTDKVENILNKIPADKKLNNKQRTLLNNLAGEFITANYGDKNIFKSVQAASDMLELSGENATAGNYKKYFEIWKMEINTVRKINSAEVLEDDLKDDLNILKETLNTVIRADIPRKYRTRMKETINDYVNETLKDSAAPYDFNKKDKLFKKKLTEHALSKVSDEKIENFYNEIQLNTQKIKKLKVSLKDNRTNQNLQHEKVIKSMVAVISEMINENDIDKFSDIVTDICNSEKVLKKADVDKFLLNEISKYSDASNNEIQKSDAIKSLSRNVLKYNGMIRADKKYQNNLKLNGEKLEDIINKYIETSVEPMYSQAIAVAIKEYIQSELKEFKQISSNEEKLWELREKLISDYDRYNYMKHPEEILERYVELSAKDGEIANAKTNKERIKLTEEKNVNESYLATALAIASIVEMQEILMDASKIGNPAIAVSKFKNYDSDLIDTFSGARATLADPKIIDYMVRSLILENDCSTAVMFVEKLGLTDKFLEIEDGMIDVKNNKQKINKIANILKTTNKQTEILVQELNKLAKYTEDEDFEEKIDKTKQEIIAKTSKLNREKVVKYILGGLDDVKILTEANPDLPKSLILNQTMDVVKSKISSETAAEIEKIQNELKQLKNVYDMISQINVPKYREGYKYKQSISDKFDEINNYNNESLKKIIKEAKAISISQVED